MNTDFLIIGSGVAGLTFALKASQYGSVRILTKVSAFESNTAHAQGGIATVWGKADSFDLHIKDTLKAGDGLCDYKAVEITVQSGPKMVKWLMDLGVQFTTMNKDRQLEFDLGMEGGHSRRRVLHVADLTGREVEKVLLQQVKDNPNIEVLENQVGVDLITVNEKGKKRCVGVFAMDRTSGAVRTYLAKVTVLATGGAGKVYLYTSNPDVATGDGVAMAYRAGAQIANMEFFQFHPTILYHPKAKSFLISEALRGEGGILRRLDGEPFMKKYHPSAELAPRDIVARAIDAEMKRTGDDHVYLDMTHLDPDFLVNRFPYIHAKCLEYGIDMRKDPIPVVPGAHYSCGGVKTDYWGKTTVDGLYAIGETAHTGLHGANRLASNSLLEALVFADRAAQRSSEEIKKIEIPTQIDVPLWFAQGARQSDETVVITQNWDEIRRFMWNYVGIVRSNRRLNAALRRLDVVAQEIKEVYWTFEITPDLIELRNIAAIAYLIIQGALWRKESRGLHYNVDYPQKNELFQRDTILWAGERIDALKSQIAVIF